MQTFHDLLATNLERDAERTAIVDGARGTSYAELAAEVERAAGWLAAAGVEPGDRVVVHLLKGVEEIAAMFAINRVGAVFVNVNRQWTEPQLRYVIADCGAVAAFMEGGRAKRMLAAEGGLGDLRVAVTGKAPDHPAVTAWGAMRSAAPAHVGGREDLAAILYTSGSTGRPKGVMLTNSNLLLGADSVTTYLGNTAEDRVLSLLPYSFDYGLNQLTTLFQVGGCVVLMRAMMPVEIVRTLVEHEVTGLPALPSIWVPLVRHLQESPTAFPHLRYLTNTGGKIPDGVLRALPEVFPGTDVYLMYGLTEAFRSTYLPPAKFAAKPGSIGQAVPHAETFVVDDELGVCGPGQQGELVHRGPLVSRGYWGRPEETAAILKPCPALASLIGDEPVLHSGDLVRIDEDGDYWYVGRRDGLIKSSGYRISPTEVEEAACAAVGVTAAIAFGTPDCALGEAVSLAVTTDGENFDQAALIAECRRNLPAYMVPTVVHQWHGEFPRTANGKLDRALVKNRCAKP